MTAKTVKEDGNVRWIDGLRGLASVLVVLTHFCRSFDPEIFTPASGPDQTPRVLQWPLVRVALQGRVGVALFAFVTGFVCALKPVRQVRSGHAVTAFETVSRSAFRRLPRLVLPASVATTVAWFLCQSGAFGGALQANSHWLSESTPGPSPDVATALRSLAVELIAPWCWGANAYDLNQWTLLPLLRVSLMVYVTVFATVRMRSCYRMMVYAMLWVVGYFANDAIFTMQSAFGMLLAELHLENHLGFPVAPCVRRVAAPSLVVAGLFLASYPSDMPEWAAWSQGLASLAAYVVPSGYHPPAYFTAFGTQMVLLGIFSWQRARDLLGHRRLCWLGSQSFAVYLLHGSLMRVVYGWAIYWLAPLPPAENGQADGPGASLGDLTVLGPRRPLLIACLTPAFFVLLYTCANLWTTWVEHTCARVTQYIENYVANSEPKMDGLSSCSLR